MELDAIDEKILSILQSDGRITNLQLAERVNLSPTPCAARVKKMEAAGVIRGYGAVVDPVATGFPLSAFVLIRIGHTTRKTADKFAKAAVSLPCVTACFMTAGKLDYILRIIARDMAHYEYIIVNQLAELPEVLSMETVFVLSDIRRGKPVAFSGG